MSAIVICALRHGLVSIESFDVRALTTALAPGTLRVAEEVLGSSLRRFLFLVASTGLSVDPNVSG